MNLAHAEARFQYSRALCVSYHSSGAMSPLKAKVRYQQNIENKLNAGILIELKVLRLP